MTKNKLRREITPGALYELFARHSQCVLDQKGKCPLLVFSQTMCWELNEFFNSDDCLVAADESMERTSSGFRYYKSGSLAGTARPVGTVHSCGREFEELE